MTIDVSPKPSYPKTYLGDGVYASFDGRQIWIETEREYGLHKIALDNSVYINLQSYAKQIDDYLRAKS